MDSMLQALGSLTSLAVIVAAFGGVLWGIFGGALPGISPSIAMALLLPFTVGMDPPPRSCCWPASTSVRSTAAASRPS